MEKIHLYILAKIFIDLLFCFRKKHFAILKELNIFPPICCRCTVHIYIKNHVELKFAQLRKNSKGQSLL